MQKLQGTIIAAPNELELYKEALSSMGIEIVETIGLANVHGEQNYRYEITFIYYDVSQVWCAGQMVNTLKLYMSAVA
jgi:hypothetical protein